MGAPPRRRDPLFRTVADPHAERAAALTDRASWPLLRALALLLPAACLIGLTWYLTLNTPDQPSPTAAGQVEVAQLVQQQVATLARRLGVMAKAWQQDPQNFALNSWRAALTDANGTPPDMVLANPQGRVTQSTLPDADGLNVHARAWFRAAQDRARRRDGAPVIGVRVDDSLRDWRVRVTRWLRTPDGRFGGVLTADARLNALATLFNHAPTPGQAAPLFGRQTALKLQAGVISALALLLAALVFAWTERARRRQTNAVAEHVTLRTTTEELLLARARADAKAAQLEATVAGMSDGVALLDPQLRLLEWNQPFADLAGVPAHLLQPGTTMEDILRAQAEAGEFGQVQVQAEIARRLAVLHTVQGERTATRTRPDGRIIELRRTLLPDGNSVALYRDVTAPRRTETALRHAHTAADAATGAKTRFVAIISHEIRSPLGALLNTLNLLGGGGLPASQQALLRMARQSGEALLALVNDLLDMSSMESGQLALRPGVFELAPLLEAVGEMFQPQAADRGISLYQAVDPDLPAALYADPVRLRQVLINLLANAVKFGVPGPVALLARKGEDAHGRSHLLLAVRDRGPVIEEAGRARLFRPFSRLDQTDGEPLGSGLGLSICRYLVTLMGGEIGCRTWVAEDGHAGNEFWVRLPLTPPPAGAQPRAADVLPRLPRTRILLVEDTVVGQLVTALLLRRDGHLVDVADTGEAALQAVAQAPYDLVLTDMHLPGRDGLDLTRQIRALPGASGQVPIVALSANTDPTDRLACERAGIGDLLNKPVGLPDLLACLARHVWRGYPDRGITLRPDAALPAPPLLADERINELRAHLPPDALRGIVEECLIDLQTRLPALRQALLVGDSAGAVNQAHAMVGMAAGYGMRALETRLRALMAAARGPHQAAAAALLEQLETELAQSADALREALSIELV